jgi:hypothetical protein
MYLVSLFVRCTNGRNVVCLVFAAGMLQGGVSRGMQEDRGNAGREAHQAAGGEPDRARLPGEG